MSPILGKLNREALKQHLDLLDQITDEAYVYTRCPVFPSSLGSHLRHDLDHYLNFFQGLPQGRIEYEKRVRDPKLETSRTHAQHVILSIIENLSTLSGTAETPLMVCVEDAGAELWTPSNVCRELDFLLSHTIHHQAIISMMVRDQGATPSPAYGMAPSTLRYQQSSCAR